MTQAFASADFLKAVQGDLDAFLRLSKQPHSKLEELRSELGELTLTAAVVRKVLLALQRGEVAAGLVQKWASFVRRGYVGNLDGQPTSKSEPILPIDINYDPQIEEQLAQVIARLDEIGDLIDGRITNEDIRLMLTTLPDP